MLLDRNNHVTFEVNVQGTSSKPVVRCLIGESPSFMFPAIELTTGKYECQIDLPDTFNEASHAFKIEVLLNGRLFTPITTIASVSFKGDKDEPIQEPVIAKVSVIEPPVSETLVPSETKITTTTKTKAVNKINIAEIAAAAESTPLSLKPLKEVKRSPAKRIPTTLIKGNIIYR